MSFACRKESAATRISIAALTAVDAHELKSAPTPVMQDGTMKQSSVIGGMDL